MKRDWNLIADRLASSALQKEERTLAVAEEGYPDIISLHWLDELLKPRQIDFTVKITAITRSVRQTHRPSAILQEALVQRLRVERIHQDQEEESWIVDMKKYLAGGLNNLSAEDAKRV